MGTEAVDDALPCEGTHSHLSTQRSCSVTPGCAQANVSYWLLEPTLATGSFWPILLKKSRRVFCRRKSVNDVEIWLGQKTELSYFLRSNAEIERLLSSREQALSETDFFNRIGQKRPLTDYLYRPLAALLVVQFR